jgi:hypothetical protein
MVIFLADCDDPFEYHSQNGKSRPLPKARITLI